MRIENAVSTPNSTTSPLGSSASFTGSWENVENIQSVVTAVRTDQNGSLFMEFSHDGVTVDSSVEFEVNANTNEVHRLSITRKFFRARLTNGSVAQTVLRLQTLLGDQGLLTSPLNSIVQKDADAVVARSITEELMLARGLLQDMSIVNKFGLNTDIDTATVPEDIWGGDGVYTGFPDTALETVSVLSSSASDAAAGTGARTVRLTGLDTNYNVIAETVTLNGTTPVATVQQFRRVHTAQVLTAGSGGVNAGTITFRHTTTTTNVFLVMQIGRNQTNCSAYTVPAGYTAYMRQLHAAISIGTTAANATGFVWTRTFGGVFRSRRPFSVSNNSRLEDFIYGGIVFTEKSDIVIRCDLVSDNNTRFSAGYDLILIKD